jgi:hypothetical protein
LHESSVSSEGEEAPTAFSPVPVTWHYTSGSAGQSAAAGPGGRWKRDAGGAQREACGGAWGGTSQEAFAVVLDLGLGQGVDVGDNLGPGA